MTAVRIDLAPAYILHRRPYRDTSLTLEALTRDHGRISLVARGARRSRRGGTTSAWLQPFAPLFLSWRQGRGEMGTLTGVEAAGPAQPLAGEPLYGGFYTNELLMRLVYRHDPHPQLFEAYGTLLAQLGPDSVAAPLRVFEKRLLEALGYGIVLAADAESGEPVQAGRHYRYVPELGPVAVPPDAADRQAFSGRLLLALAREQLTEVEAAGEARRLLANLLSPLLGDRPLHSRALLRQSRRDY